MQHSSGTGRFGFVKRMLVPVIVGAALAVLAPAPTWAQAPTCTGNNLLDELRIAAKFGPVWQQSSGGAFYFELGFW